MSFFFLENKMGVSSEICLLRDVPPEITDKANLLKQETALSLDTQLMEDKKKKLNKGAEEQVLS